MTGLPLAPPVLAAAADNAIGLGLAAVLLVLLVMALLFPERF